MEPDNEQYLESIIISIKNSYPELSPILNEKLSFLDKPDKEKIFYMIDEIASKFKDVPLELIQRTKDHYLNDNRPFSEIAEEILDFTKKIQYAEAVVNRPINEEILNSSVLLIGPMGTGKSTVAEELSRLTGFPIISLDDRKKLYMFYQNNKDFKNFKEFEFYLTSNVLTSINRPCIIDFGAGHSIYENPIMFYEMKKLITKFKNIELLLPSEDLEESLKIINTRLKDREDISVTTFLTNKHFIESPCNYELATNIVYTKDMTPEEIAFDIVNRINNINLEETSHIK